MKQEQGFEYGISGKSVERPPISIDGPEFVQVPEKMKQRIKLALKAQEHVDERIYSLEILSDEPDLITKLLEGINCHKAVLYLRGEISRKALAEKASNPARGGYKELRKLGDQHAEDFTLFSEDILEYTEAHQEQFPFSVHVFSMKQGEMRPAHSFVLLGKDAQGRYVCFHKVGPYPDMPFELTTMETILKPYDTLDTAFLILPIETGE